MCGCPTSTVQKQDDKIQSALGSFQADPILKSKQEHINNLVSQLYKTILQEQTNKSGKIGSFAKKLQPNAEMKCKNVAEYGKQMLGEMNYSNTASIKKAQEVITVSSRIVMIGQHYKKYAEFQIKQLNGLANYIQKETSQSGLRSCTLFIHQMLVNRQCSTYSSCQLLFRKLVERFSQMGADETKQMVVKILITMMLKNKLLIKFANAPYYFLQFWLYMINAETKLDQKLYWISCVTKLYSADANAQETLFYGSDFKVFVDLLVMVMGRCSDGQTLKVPLECYLNLSSTSKMKPKALRVDDVKEFIEQINAESLGLQNICRRIRAVK